MREPLIGGGWLVRVHGAEGLAVEGVAHPRRGHVVYSALSIADAGRRVRAGYRLTQRAVIGTDLWRVRRIEQALDDQGGR